MIEVSGYAAMQAKASLIPYTFERRPPADNDVVIEIQYCGICHTDIHQVNNEWGGSSNYPMVPGHENHWYSDRSGPQSDSVQSGR